MSNPTYTQPLKKKARRQLLSTAVAALTTKRSDSPLVREEELLGVIEYATSWLSRINVQMPWLDELHEQTAKFLEFHRDEVGNRKPSELKVLYLCGPEPINDLRLLLALGCRPENIWGVEKEKELYEKAVKELKQSGTYIKIHQGSLSSFFDQVNDRFDLVYYDGCGPLPGGKPNTILPVLSMFSMERLADLSVFVTNFAEPPSIKEAEYSSLMANYFSPRYNDTPHCLFEAGYDPAIGHLDVNYALGYVQRHMPEVYSDFVTRLLVDIGRTIIPFVRVGSNPEVSKKFFIPESELKKRQKQALNLPKLSDFKNEEDWFKEIIHSKYVQMVPQSYPLLSFLTRGSESSKGTSLLQPMLDFSTRRGNIRESFISVALLENAYAGHFDIASPEMIRAFQADWFDRKPRYFCDVPLPHLIVSLLVGTYGHPYFYNPVASARIQYRAKDTLMYSDAIVLDQCRYVFNLIPTIDLIPNRFKSVAFQVLVRACLDRIGWHDYSSSSHPFRFTALGGIREHPYAKPFELPGRKEVKN